MVMGYCVKCKKKVTIQGGKTVTFKNGAKAIAGYHKAGMKKHKVFRITSGPKKGSGKGKGRAGSKPGTSKKSKGSCQKCAKLYTVRAKGNKVYERKKANFSSAEKAKKSISKATGIPMKDLRRVDTHLKNKYRFVVV